MTLLSVAGAVGSAIWWQRDGRKLAGHSRTVEKVSSHLQSWQHGIGHQLQRVPLIGNWLIPRGRSQPARQSWQMQEPTSLAGQAAARRMKKVRNSQRFNWITTTLFCNLQVNNTVGDESTIFCLQ